MATTDTAYRSLDSIYEQTPKAIAQRQLWGKSHYCDDDTLRFFKSRVCEVAVSADCNRFGIIERLPIGSFDAPRQYRVVIFDAEGRVANDKPTFGSKRPALKALAELIG